MNLYVTEDRLFLRVLQWAADLAAVAVMALFLALTLGREIRIEGKSMEPVLHDGDIVLVDQICYNFLKPSRFDLAVVQLTDGRQTVKRIVGLPGERLQIADGRIYINGTVLDTRGTIGEVMVPGEAASELEIPAGHYFLLGDNTGSSEDSRSRQVGFVSRDQILGKVWFRIGGLADLEFL
ncbi:signal peptidase I [Cuneatibacter caecimuris]|uniref:Signal peptidase I n=1 Tax=Cuneatibacter caecimuris TaxID=1796618 RepID=A0A4Q7PM67_9FIRM|nr:signal peptidase I [Cuneatibacter caecimuris]RZT01962.1 signal peptidase I [Cuneatibacter caecimuris]